MNSDKEEKGCCGGNESKEDSNCCGGNHDHDHSDGCGCGGHDNKDSDGCCGGGHDHDHGDGCGCGGHDHDHDEHHHSVTLTLEDDTELNCPIVDAFEINEQQYMALLHPVDETVLLYRFFENDDDTLDLETIESDEEFELVSKTFMSLQED